MKHLLLILAFVLGFAGVGAALCLVMGWPTHVVELCSAAAVAIVAGSMALWPALRAWQRHDPLAEFARSALLSTVLHLFLIILLAASLTLAGLTGLRQPFLFWMLTLYWASLLAVVIVLTQWMRQLSPQAASTNAGRPATISSEPRQGQTN